MHDIYTNTNTSAHTHTQPNMYIERFFDHSFLRLFVSLVGRSLGWLADSLAAAARLSLILLHQRPKFNCHHRHHSRRRRRRHYFYSHIEFYESLVVFNSIVWLTRSNPHQYGNETFYNSKDRIFREYSFSIMDQS